MIRSQAAFFFSEMGDLDQEREKGEEGRKEGRKEGNAEGHKFPRGKLEAKWDVDGRYV